MYYDRYMRSIVLPDTSIPRKAFDNLWAEDSFNELVAWFFTDFVGATQGLNLTCYRLVEAMWNIDRANVVDDEGTLSYFKVLTHSLMVKFTGKFEAAAQLMGRDAALAASRGLGHSIRYAFHMLSFKLHGFQRYQVSEGLAMELMETEFPDLRCQDVRLPHPTIFIEVPKCLGFYVHNATTGRHPLEGVFLSEDRCILRQKEGARLKSGRSEIDKVTLEVGRTWNGMMIGLSKNPDDPMDDATCLTTMDMVDDRPLEQEVAATARAADLDENFKRFPIIMQWVTNVLLYATWPDALLEQAWADPKAEKLWKAAAASTSKGQIKKLRAKIKQHHPTGSVTLLGRNILVDRTTPTYRATAGGEGRELDVRIRVTGHMKRQAYGPRYSERKIIWIRPYWRGPEDGPVKFSGHQLVAKHQGGTGDAENQNSDDRGCGEFSPVPCTEHQDPVGGGQEAGQGGEAPVRGVDVQRPR